VQVGGCFSVFPQMNGPLKRIRKPMLYPLSYEGLSGVWVTRSRFDGQVDGRAGNPEHPQPAVAWLA